MDEDIEYEQPFGHDELYEHEHECNELDADRAAGEFSDEPDEACVGGWCDHHECPHLAPELREEPCSDFDDEDEGDY